MDDEKAVTITNTHVPDKLYGYGLQVRQMLYELLNCGIDCVVSVEKFDDVGVEMVMRKLQYKQKVRYQIEILFQTEL